MEFTQATDKRLKMMRYAAQYDSPFGTIAMYSDGTALTGLRIGTPLSFLEEGGVVASVFGETRCWLDIYFSGRMPGFIPPIKLYGTDFQRRVWQALMGITYGETTTYGKLARRIGCRSAQAVGQAVGRNPIAIIVPCHRVIGSDGSLTGYAYGLDCKQYLLHLEKK